MTEGTMKAARIAAPGKVETMQVPIPEPGPGQLRFRVHGCAVCASNLGPWEGLPWLNYPLGPGEGGHEAWGQVDALGEGVRGPLVGTRIAALSYKSYAEYDLAQADAVVPLPASLEDLPFPGEPMGCAFNIFTRSGVGPGEVVAVVGVGFLGAILVHLSAAVGATVLALSRRGGSLELARRMGASEVVPLEDHQGVLRRVGELTGGRLCDRVIEATGKQWPLDLSAELTRERGTLIIAGYHQDGPRQVNMQLWNWRGLDVINAHERDPAVYVRGMRGAVEAADRGGLDFRPLLTHTYRLEELGRALEDTASRPEGFVKAMVRP